MIPFRNVIVFFQPIEVIDQNLLPEASFTNCVESGWSNQDLHFVLQKSNVTYMETEECQKNPNFGKLV